MEKIDKIVFGDNQFFGINHRSQEKAEEMLKRFSDVHNILKVYDDAFDCGVKAVMLNSNDRAEEMVSTYSLTTDSGLPVVLVRKMDSGS